MKKAHVHLTDDEERELARLGDELGQSGSGVLRIGLRLMAGLPVPSRILEQHREQIIEGAHESRLSATG